MFISKSKILPFMQEYYIKLLQLKLHDANDKALQTAELCY